MTWRRVAGAALLTLGLVGCDKLGKIPIIGQYFAPTQTKARPGTPAVQQPPKPALSWRNRASASPESNHTPPHSGQRST